MSAGNYFNTRKQAYDLRTKTITNLSTYTVKVGSPSDNFVVDAVLKIVTTASGNDLTLTVPNGEYSGQRLLLIFDTQGDDETVTVSVTTGDTVTFDAADEWVELMWIDNSIGWKKSRYATGV